MARAKGAANADLGWPSLAPGPLLAAGLIDPDGLGIPSMQVCLRWSMISIPMGCCDHDMQADSNRQVLASHRTGDERW